MLLHDIFNQLLPLTIAGFKELLIIFDIVDIESWADFW